MDRRTFLTAAATIAPTAAFAPTAALARSPSLRDQVLGAWRIRDAETVNIKTGASAPWLGRPRPYSGMIVYLANGMMTVQISAARGPSRAGAGLNSLSDDEKIGLLDTYYAYYGRFEVDEARSKVRHFVEGSLFDFETGATLVRTIKLSDGVLTLTTDNLVAAADGSTFNRLTWTRL